MTPEKTFEKTLEKSMTFRFWRFMKQSFEDSLPLFENFRRRLVKLNLYKPREFQEYAQFMILKALALDTDAKLLSPGFASDQLWHLHLQDEKDYSRVCQRLVGTVIHHEPKGQHDPTQVRDKREERAELLRRVFFGFANPTEMPCQYHQSDEEAKDKNEDESETKTLQNSETKHEAKCVEITFYNKHSHREVRVQLPLDQKLTEEKVLRKICELLNLGKSSSQRFQSLRLCFRGVHILPEDTCSTLALQKGDKIQVMDLAHRC